MKKNNTSKVFEGALVGAIFGIVAGMLIAPKSGKDLRNDIKNKSVDFYKYISPQLKKMEKMGKIEYGLFMKQAIQKYGKLKKLSEEQKIVLMREVQKLWTHIHKHL